MIFNVTVRTTKSRETFRVMASDWFGAWDTAIDIFGLGAAITVKPC